MDERPGRSSPAGLSRRAFLRGVGAVAAAAGLPAVLAACGDTRAAQASPRTLKIGYVSPQTGPLAAFAEADAFVLSGVEAALAGGLDVANRSHPVEVIVRDTASSAIQARDVARELVEGERVDLVAVASTPETTIPVSGVCEQLGVPCISTMTPWQTWFNGRSGAPRFGFEWTYHFCGGLEDVIAVSLDMWGQVDTERRVGGLWPNDSDGIAWSSPLTGFPPALTNAGYEVIDAGRYTNLDTDFRDLIERFKHEQVDILSGVPLPPDFAAFWQRAADMDWRPAVATVGRAVLFPSTVEALGALGYGLSTEIGWAPQFPFASSLTGQSAGTLASEYTAQTGRQWTQAVGFVHGLFEVAIDVLRRTQDADDPEAIKAALRSTELDTAVGRIAWTGRPVPNVAKTPVVGGQWVRGDDFPCALRVVSNRSFPDIPVEAALQPLGAG